MAKGLARQYFSRYWENLRINFKSNITRGLNVEDDILQLPVIQISQQTVKAAESRAEDRLKMFRVLNEFKKTSLNLELFLCLSSDRQKPGGLPEGPQLTNNKQTQRTEEETFSHLQQASSHAPSLCCTPLVMEVRYLTNQRYLRDHNGSPSECPDSNVTHSDSLRSCGTFCLPIRVQQNVSIKRPEPRSAPCCSDKTQLSCCTEVNRFITCV